MHAAAAEVAAAHVHAAAAHVHTAAAEVTAAAAHAVRRHRRAAIAARPIVAAEMDAMRFVLRDMVVLHLYPVGIYAAALGASALPSREKRWRKKLVPSR